MKFPFKQAIEKNKGMPSFSSTDDLKKYLAERVTVLIFVLLLLLGCSIFVPLAAVFASHFGLGILNSKIAGTTVPQPVATMPSGMSDVLAEFDDSPASTISPRINFNIPTNFSRDVYIQGNLLVQGRAVMPQGIEAPNVIYDIEAGPGIQLDGDQIVTLTNTGVLSIQGTTGDIAFEAGTGIEVDGLTINNTGVTSINGETGEVTLTAGEGIAINGTTISLDVAIPESSNSFATIDVAGQDSIQAGSNDTLTFVGGTGVTVSTDASTKTITINSTGISVPAGWTDDGSIVRLTNVSDFVGIGTNTPSTNLHVVGNTTLDGNVNISGTITFGGLADGIVRATGGVLTSGDVVLGTDTSGNYVATIAAGTGISITGSLGEGWSPTVGLGALTSDWNQTGAFDIILNNADSQIQILGASGANYGTIDVTTLTANRSYTFPNQSGEVCLSTGNCAGSGAGIGGSGTASRIPRFNSAFSVEDSSIEDLYQGGVALTIDAAGNIGIGTTNPQHMLDVAGGIKVGDGSALMLGQAAADPNPASVPDGSLYYNTTDDRFRCKEAGNWKYCDTSVSGGSISGAGATNRIAFYDSTSTISYDNNLVWDDATQRFGLGTSAPATLLDVNGAATFRGNFTLGSDTFSDITGTGLIVSGTSLATTLGTDIDLTTEVTGVLPTANGGLGVNASTASNGQILIGNGTGFSLATITQGTGIGITNAAGAITIANTGVTSISGTANQITASGSTGAVTLSLPQDIHTDANVIFNSITLDQQGAINLLAYGTSAGNTSEIRFGELAANGSSYTGFKAPDSLAGNLIYTLPATDGAENYILTTSGSGDLSWSSLAGVGATNGDITAVGDVTTGDAFTSTGTSGTSLYFYDADGRGQLTIANLTAARTFTLPDISGTFAMLEGSQTFLGAKTFNAGLSVAGGQSITIGGDSISEFVGDGLQISSGTLSTTLGTTVNLASAEVTAILGTANGGTGLDGSSAANGTLLIGNGAGYSLATITQGTGITVTNGSGSITIANSGVTSITGTANRITASASTGGITLNLPQDIHTDAVANFNSLTLDAQEGLTLDPYGIASGNTSEVRFKELATSGTNYTGFKAPNTLDNNVIYTLPSADGSADYILTTDGSGNLSWQSLAGVGATNGDITAVGDGTSGDVFTATGTSGTSLYFYDADGRGQLTIANLTAARTFTLPDISGTFAMLEGSQTFTGAKTFNNNLTVSGSGTFSIGGDTFSELVGDGLQISSGTLSTTLGTSVDLTSEVIGILPTANGGLGVNASSATNGQLLIGNGTGFSMTTLTQGTGIGITNAAGAITIANTGVTSITGTANQITASGSTGAITLSLPQNIDTNAVVAFNSLTVDTQAGIVLNPFGSSAGNTSEIRFGELAGNGSSYTGFKAPDSLANNVIYTLPSADGLENYILTTSGSGDLSWQSLAGVGATNGDITAVGDTTSGDAFTSTGTSGTSLYFYDADGRGQLTITDLTAARTFTLPDISGTFAMLEGTQTFLGAKTFNAGLSVAAGQSITIGGASILDFVGDGLQISSGTLSTTLGTSVDLASEVTGVLPVANGGLGVNASTASNGQLLIGNGTGFSLASITQGTGIGITNAAGAITIANTGVTSITGTANQVTASASSGAITLSLPQDIATNSNVTFASLTLNTQAGLTLNPYGSSAGNTSEIRFGELTANGSSYTGFKAPDSLAGNVIYTLPTSDGSENYILTTNGSGNLSWQSLSGVGGTSGDITAIGDVTSGDAFTASSTQGTSLYFYDTDGRGQLTIADLTAARNYTLPDITGTFAMLEGAQTFLGAKTFGSGLSISTGQSITIGGSSISDFVGDGLQISSGTLSTILGTSVDLASEVTGILPTANGGTGLDGSSAANGSLLVGNGTGFSLATITQGAGISISNGTGSITIANSGVTSITGTANQILASGSTGAITLSLPQDIDSSADVNFNTLSLNGQAGLTLNPYGSSAGNTSEIRFGELSANGSSYTGFKAPDSLANTIVYTLPSADGLENYILTTSGSGDLSWQSLAGVGGTNGDITAVGDGTSGDVFTSTGTSGTSLYFYDADGRGQLTIANLTAARTFTLPDISGTFAMLEGNQTFTGAKTFGAGLSISSGQSITIGGDSISEFVGDGLQISSGTLSTTLGTSVSLTSEVTGILPTANGGTGVNSSTAGNGQLLIGNGTGFSLATITQGTGIGITNAAGAITIANTGVTSITGTANRITASASSGAITLNLPQDIATNSNVTFGSLTLNTQAGLTLNPYGSSAGNTSEIRFGELAANGSSYTGFKAPDSLAGNVIYTLPAADGSANYILTTSGSGDLSWSSLAGVGGTNGDITAIGDVTSGDAFTASSTQGTSLYFYDTDGRGQLTIADLTAARTFTLPDISGTFAMLEGTQTFTGAKTFNNSLTVGGSGTFTIGGDTFSELVGDGLQISSGTLSTTLGNTVDLTSEVTGILPTANGGLGVNASSATNGQLLIGNGTGFSLATITQGTGIGITNAAGAITIANTGVTSITGTTNQITANASSGSITLSLPQDIATNSNVNFASLTLNTQAGLTLNPYGSSAGNTSEIRFGELAANGYSYTGFKAPDSLASSVIYTLPSADGSANYILTTNGSGDLSWSSLAGVGGTNGDITAVGDGTSGDVFTSTGTSGTSLYFYDVDGRGQLTIADLSAARTFTLPDISGTFAMLEGTQTFTGAKTFNNNLTVNGSGTFTIGGDTFSELVGAGLQVSSGTLSTTLGTSVDLTSEITGILPTANGGTGVNASSATNGQLLIGNGTGFSLATITQGTGIGITNAAGAITIANTGVTSITGTANQIIASGSTGAVTLSLPQDIDTSANVNFNTLSLRGQAGLTLNPYGTSAGNTSEIRFAELAANGSNYTGFRAPDSIGSNVIYTLPSSDGLNNYVLTTNGSGQLQWNSVSGAGGGTVNQVGSMSSSAVFASAAADDQWLGLGATAGRIAFDDQSTDYVNILNAFMGIGTSAPTVELDILGDVQIRNGNEIRFADSDSSNYVGFKAPASVTSSLVYTLPAEDGSANYVLSTDGAGNLEWKSVTGVGGGAGTITAIGDVTSGNAFTAAGTAGTSLYFYDADGRGQLTIDNLTAARTYTLPDLTGTFALLEGTQTFTGGKTFSGTATFSNSLTANGNVVLGDSASDTLAINSTILGATPFIFEGSTSNTNQTTLSITDPTADRIITIPDADGTFAVSASGPISLSAAGDISCPTCLTSSSNLFTLAASNGSNQTVSLGSTVTFAQGSGITTTASSTNTVTIAATLGTDIDLTSEVTGVLPTANGGTGVNGSTAGNGQLLIGNGSGYTLSTLTQGTGIGITNAAGAITIVNTGVTSITGTANQVTASASSGAITLSLPQNIATNSNVTFASLTLNTQAGLTLNPYGSSAGNTSEIRFGELAANGSSYTGFKAPDSLANNVIYTLPSADGSANYILTTSGSGDLSWSSLAGVGATNGDITAVGDVTTGDAFTSTGTSGTSLYFYDADGRGQLTIANLTAARTFTLPDISGTFAMLEGSQTFLGAKTFNAGLSVGGGQSITIGGDSISEFVGDGLQISSGTLSTTLGTSVSLTSEVTGILPTANGGTGVNSSTAGNGQLLIGNGTGFSLATITQGTGIGITNAAGAITIANTGVTSITGTANQITASGSTGAVTLSLPQDIATNSNVSFASLTLNTQAGLTLNPYGSSAGNTSEIRFGELAANGSNYTGFRAPDSLTNNLIYTLPATDGSENYVLTTSGSGDLSWNSVTGVGGGNGDITAVGDGTSGDVFTATGTSGTSLYFYDADGRGQLTIADLTAARTFTLPDISGTFAMLEGSQTFSGAKTFSSGLTVSSGQSFGLGGESITDLTGTGIIISGNALTATLGTDIDLASSEVTGILGTANGGTGVNSSTAGNGQLLIGNGTGYSLTTLTQGTGIGITNAAGAITIANTGVTSITGTANRITASASSGAVTLNLPQDIHTDAVVNFNSLTLDAQAGLTLNSYGSSAGNTSEIRFGELAANGSNYTGFKAPDSLANNVIYTLPSADGSANYILTTNGSGNLSWSSLAGVGATNGDITAVGDGTSGDVFTATGTSGTSLYFYDVDGRGQLTIADLTAARTFTLPDITGTFAMLEGSQTFTGAKTFNNSLTVGGSGTFTIGGDTFSELVGAGLQISSGTLSTTLGTSVDLTSEVTGILPTANGGTGINSSTAGNGQLLIGNGTGFSLATITQGTGIGITNAAGAITIANTGVTSITGTTNRITASASSGAITLNLPQDIHTDAVVNFNSLTLDAQAGLTLNPYGSSAGNTSEVRFSELAANGSNFTGFRAPDSLANNLIYTLPATDGSENYVLTTSGSGNLSWTSADGIVSGDISAVGDVTSGPAFTASGTQGTSLYFYDADGRGQLTIANLTAARTFTLPDITGTFAMLEGTQTFTGAKTFNNSLIVNGSGTFTIGGDTFSELVGNGLQISSGTLSTTLGTSVDLTSEVTGILPTANGGTGVNSSTAGNGQLLIGNGTGFSLATITQGTGIGITNAAGAITIANTGVTSISGTANQITASGSTGAVTLSLPQDIATNSNVNFGSLTVNTQGGLALNAYGTSAGNTSEIRFGELAANGSNYTGFKAPDSLAGNIIYTLPSTDGSANYILTTSGSGNLSWQSLAGIGATDGDITAVGSMLSGNAFSDASADGQWLGLGATAGRIEFNDDTTDQVNILGSNVGIGTSNPGQALDVAGNIQLSGGVRFGGSTYQIAPGADSGLNFSSAIDATKISGFNFNSSVSTGGVANQNGVLMSQSKNIAEAFSFNGLNIDTTINASSGTQNIARGILSTLTNSTGGSITDAYAIMGRVDHSSTGTIGSAVGLYLDSNTDTGSGAITNNYGLWIAPQTSGSSDFGARIDAADTATLWLSGNTNSTSSTGGISFGSSRDTNLYRSAADTLRTDDSFSIGAALTASGSVTFSHANTSTSGALYSNSGIIMSEAALNTIRGGTGFSSYTQGDMLFASNSTALSKLSIGTSGYILTSSGTAPQWSATISGTSITDDTLDFAQFEDTMDLDANLILNQTTFSWTQNSSVSSGTGYSYVANSLTSGTGNSITSSATGMSGTLGAISLTGSHTDNTGTVFKVTNAGALNTGTALMVTNNGASVSTSFRVNDDGSDSDSTPFIIDADGNVAIGATSATNGKLDVNGDIITRAQGDIRLGDADSSNYIALQAPASVSSNYTLTLPTALPGGSNYALIGNASGDLSWMDLTGVTAGADITAVGSMTSGAVFANAGADGQWLGLGATAGRIRFDDLTTDSVSILSAFLGVGTSSPDYIIHSVSSDTSNMIVSEITSDFYDARVNVKSPSSQGGLIAYGSSAGTNSFLDGNVALTSFSDHIGVASFNGDVFLATGSTITPRLWVENGGQIGIGTTTANAQLDVLAASEQLRLSYNSSNYTSLTVGASGDITLAPTGGDTSITGTLTSSGALAGATVTDGTTTFADTAWTSTGGLAWDLATSATALNIESGLFNIDTSNNRIGIGTTSPNAKLDILSTSEQLRLAYNGSNYTSLTTSASGTLSLAPSGGNTINTGNLKVGDGYQLIHANGTSDPTGTPGAQYFNTSTNKFRCYNNSAWADCGGSVLGQGLAGQVTFWNGIDSITGTAAFTWDAANNRLGIGTSAPASALSVGSSSQFQVDTSGKVFAGSGTAATPAFSFTSDTNTGIWNDGADMLGFGTSGAERMRISATGNVGIGTTAPSSILDVASTATTGTGMNFVTNSLTSGTGVNISSTSTSFSSGILTNIAWNPSSSTTATGDLLRLSINSNANIGNFINIVDNGTSLFSISESAFTTSLPASFTAPGDVAIANDLIFTNQIANGIKSNGPLTIASGEIFESNNLSLRTYNSGKVVLNAAAGAVVEHGGSSGNLIQFTNSAGTQVGLISFTGTTTTYGTSSDMRIKNDLGITGKGLADLLNINVRDYTFTTDNDGRVHTGFFAQELAQIFPEAVAIPDNEQGLWAVDYGRITPLLVRGIQEQQELINALTIVSTTNESSFNQQNTSLNNYKNSTDSRLSQMEHNIATMSAALAQIQTTTNVGDVASISARLTNLEQRTTAVEEQVASLSAKLADLMIDGNASGSANLASDSAELANLTVADNTVVNNLGVTGTLTAGMMTIEGLDAESEAAINTLAGPLKLQALGLNGIEIMGEKITMDTDGNIVTSGSITASKVKIDTSNILSASAGTGKIVTGATSTVIETTAVTADSLIFVTATTKTGQQLAVTTKVAGTSFKVEIPTAQAQDISFNWWIVDEVTGN